MNNSPTLDSATEPTPPNSVLMVPIRSLGENHRDRIAVHLKALDANDRYYRFGYAASDSQIDAYVSALNFARDEIFGIYNRHLRLIAMAHLAFARTPAGVPVVEFGVSVLAKARGRQYGARLFERAVMHARNEGVQVMYVHVLSENTAMLKIARHCGAVFVRDGAESEAHLKLTPATLNTHLTEMVEEHMAQANYLIKRHAKHWRDAVDDLQSPWI
jgi:GNAT superfamily N-acetyltransferase